MGRILSTLFALAALVGLLAGANVLAHDEKNDSATTATATPRVRLIMPIMSSERGKRLFVDKGCVACHAINGVGGHDAPPMDAHTMQGLMNPFEFAARMWNHAPGMIAAQEGAFGEMITFTGEELADITAFVHDDRAQHDFSDEDLTPKAQKMMHHEHGGTTAPAAHAEEIGHKHAPGAPAHNN